MFRVCSSHVSLLCPSSPGTGGAGRSTRVPAHSAVRAEHAASHGRKGFLTRTASFGPEKDDNVRTRRAVLYTRSYTGIPSWKCQNSKKVCQ